MAGPRYVVRELRAEEWERLLTMPPFRDMGRVTLSPASDAVKRPPRFEKSYCLQ